MDIRGQHSQACPVSLLYKRCLGGNKEALSLSAPPPAVAHNPINLLNPFCRCLLPLCSHFSVILLLAFTLFFPFLSHTVARPMNQLLASQFDLVLPLWRRMSECCFHNPGKLTKNTEVTHTFSNLI